MSGLGRDTLRHQLRDALVAAEHSGVTLGMWEAHTVDCNRCDAAADAALRVFDAHQAHIRREITARQGRWQAAMQAGDAGDAATEAGAALDELAWVLGVLDADKAGAA